MNDISLQYEKVLNDFKNMRSGRIKRQVRNVLNLIELAEGDKILEIGVATGKFTGMMSNNNKVLALDISMENLKRAKKTVSESGNINNLFCITADCSSMPFSYGSFDKVVAIDVIEHLNDKVFALMCKEAHRVVKINGFFYIYTPNLLHPYELSRPFRPIMKKEHIGVRSRAKICEFLKKENFIIEKGYFNNCFRRISVKAKKI